MRTRTFVFSFLVHSAVLGVAMVVRLVATTELPDPPIATRFMVAAPVDVPEVPPPPRTAPSTPGANTDTVPLEAPNMIAPEVPREVLDAIPDGPGLFTASGDSPIGVDIGPPPPPRAVAPPPSQLPVRPGGIIRAPQKIRHVAPTYPPIAQAARVSGVVILDALIAEDGSVRDVRVLRSMPLLEAAAIDAVRQWRFTPTLLNGVPVQVIMTVTVTFTLN